LKDLEHKFVIGYAGGMGESNALGFLLDAAKLIVDKPLAIVLIGDGACKAELQQRVIDENLTNIHFLPAISKLQIPDFLSRCDGLYIGWNKLPIYRFGICPNKLFDYMLAEKPIIHSVTAGNDLVAEADCGISVVAEDSTAIGNALVRLSNLQLSVRDQMARNGRNFVLANHDYRILATRFLDSVS
jgi:glycosyltransferase involved in cell wall biosynthesis